MRKIGFIGCGHMAKALIKGLKSNKSYEILGHDRNSTNIAWLQNEKIPFYTLKEICQTHSKRQTKELTSFHCIER